MGGFSSSEGMSVAQQLTFIALRMTYTSAVLRVTSVALRMTYTSAVLRVTSLALRMTYTSAVLRVTFVAQRVISLDSRVPTANLRGIKKWRKICYIIFFYYLPYLLLQVDDVNTFQIHDPRIFKH
jgi:hypothetical protein